MGGLKVCCRSHLGARACLAPGWPPESKLERRRKSQTFCQLRRSPRTRTRASGSRLLQKAPPEPARRLLARLQGVNHRPPFPLPARCLFCPNGGGGRVATSKRLKWAGAKWVLIDPLTLVRLQPALPRPSPPSGRGRRALARVCAPAHLARHLDDPAGELRPRAPTGKSGATRSHPKRAKRLSAWAGRVARWPN